MRVTRLLLAAVLVAAFAASAPAGENLRWADYGLTAEVHSITDLGGSWEYVYDIYGSMDEAGRDMVGTAQAFG